MELVDTHCHLQFDKLADNIGEVMSAAGAAGVTRMICVGTTVADSRQAVEYAAKFDNVWASVGAHPHDGKDFDYANEPAELEQLLTKDRVVAIGEVGLDFYKDYSPKPDQEKLLRTQLELGLPTGLPFIFHVRDAWDDFWRILDGFQNIRGVIHSFSAHQKQLDQALARGFYIGLNGIMTFSKDEGQLVAAKNVPNDRLVLETDAPFLAPVPFRGQTCEPKHVAATAEFLAKLREQSVDDLSKATTANVRELFGI